MIYRDIIQHLQEMARQFRVVGLVGPRQAGKSTLIEQAFPKHRYVNLENINTLVEAKNDPLHFLTAFPNEHGLIIDEAQNVPELFSSLQVIVDKQRRPGFYILTGSQNFLLNERISQSLAGRIGLVELLPLSVHELQEAALLPTKIDELILRGGYPELYAHGTDLDKWFAAYIRTYIERDVRQAISTVDLVTFQKFLRLAAARVGNLISWSDLARDADNMAPNTAKSWMSVLQASYIVTLLPPYFENVSKPLVKSPKLYFLDTGLACALLRIRTVDDLIVHPLRGALFESFIISELFKSKFNYGLLWDYFFWGEAQGYEVDVVIEKAYKKLIPLEIKASMTLNPAMFANVTKWLSEHRLQAQPEQKGYVIYGGDENIPAKAAEVISWRHVHDLIQKLYLAKNLN